MAILDFQKPDKVVMLDSNSTVGRFEFRPLEPGYGMTIGNSLRRVLLSSLEGYAITSIKIEGVDHEFSTISGVLEDVIEIILNIKQIRLKSNVEGAENETATIQVSNSRVLTAQDISDQLSVFKVLNPELVICHLEENVSFQMTVNINKGRGYVPAQENKTTDELGVIPIDAIFTPIKNVKYSVEPFRVEQMTDFEKLNIEIHTDGSIQPKDALRESAKILIQHFMLFSDEKIIVEVEEKFTTEDFDDEVIQMRQLLKQKLTDIDLSVRALNCLKTADVETLAELVRYQKNDLLKFRNFGRKSLIEIEDKLISMGLSFGMNLAKYKLDKE